jgi:ankyrin repeat protein
MVKMLLEHKALPNLEDDNGETSLHLAAKNGHLACLNELLLSGGDANLKNNNGNTP